LVFWSEQEMIALTFGAQLWVRRAVRVCNRPDADVTRVACVLNLQGLLAAAAVLHAAAHTH
jgi:hypothetical protein